MKTRLLIPVLLLSAASAARAQMAVVDPVVSQAIFTLNANSASQWAQAIQRYEQQISNQMEQMQQLRDILKGQTLLNARVGDWQTVINNAKSLRLQADKLTEKFGKDYLTLLAVDSSTDLNNTNQPGMAPVTMTTQLGELAKLADPTAFARYKTVDKLYANMNAVLNESDKEVDGILRDIAATTVDINNSTTQAETEKLKAKLMALQTALANLQRQRAEAIQRVVAQQALNQNQAAKEEKATAVRESQNAREQLRSLSNVSVSGNYY